MSRPRETKPRPFRSQLARIWLPVFLTALVVAGVGRFDPFGTDQALNTAATRALQEVTAPLYPNVSNRDTLGQKMITVVLIDPRYYAKVFPGSPRPLWPLPNDVLAVGLIGRLLAAHPIALFADVALTDIPREVSRGEGARLSRDLAEQDLASSLLAQTGGVPLFLADPVASGSKVKTPCGIDQISPSNLSTARAMAPSLAAGLFAKGKSDIPVHAVDVSWTGSSASYPLAPLLLQPHAALCQGGDAASPSALASPALALFEAYTRGCRGPDTPMVCRKRSDIAKLAQAISTSTPVFGDGFNRYALRSGLADEPIELQWGLRVPDAMRRYANMVGSAAHSACSLQYASHWSRWSGLIEAARTYAAELDHNARDRIGGAFAQPCTFINTISAGDLDLQATHPGDLDVENDLIKDHIVLLGAALPGSSDWFETPVNGYQPGVMLHATALENLLARGIDYRRSRLLSSSDRAARLGFLAVTAFFVPLALEYIAKIEAWRLKTRSRFTKMLVVGRWLLLLVALFPISLGYVYIIYRWTNWPLTLVVVPLIIMHLTVLSAIYKDAEHTFKRLLVRVTRRSLRSGAASGRSRTDPAA